ncbi:MAG: hypothetical protein K6E51_14035 [Treponema sp.]|nr:hypothetical protein [Treponema sp.]
MAYITTVCLSSTLQKTISFKHFVPEHVNRSEYYRLDASGKAVNSARVLHQLEPGCSEVICPLGQDNASRFLELAERDGLTVHTVLIPGTTRECWTLLDRTARTTTELVISEPTDGIDVSTQAKELLDCVDSCMKNSRALLLAGSRPKIWPEDFSARICKMGYDNGKIVMADFWGEDLRRTLQLCTPHIIKINEEEFCGTFDYRYPLSEEELQAKLCQLSKQLRTLIVVTRGVKSTFAADHGTFYSMPVEHITQIVNTTACGDSFSAGFLHEYLAGGTVESALQRGTWCAARNAEQECPGTIRA